MVNDTQTRIMHSWAYGHAYDVRKPKTEKDWDLVEHDVNVLLTRLKSSVDVAAENDQEFTESPASEKSVKYMRRLFMQYGKGRLNAKNVDGFLESVFGKEPVQDEVSQAIDTILSTKSTDDWDTLGDKILGIDDGEPPAGAEDKDGKPVEPDKAAHKEAKAAHDKFVNEQGTDVY